jgi:hypothetical protein
VLFVLIPRNGARSWGNNQLYMVKAIC